MLDSQTVAIVSCFAAVMSAVATFFAAWAAIRGPKAAAELAEKMRATTDLAAEKRRTKLFIFTTLMRERASMASVDAVGCLNLIDIIYIDSHEVREAWSELYASFEPAANVPVHVREERTRRLLKAMAADIGLADQLRGDDFSRIYYPNALAEAHRVEEMERKANLEHLTGKTSQQEEQQAGATPAGWPPKPKLQS